ncbi:hypothetical protein HAX54_023338 [Datura stramonium]|uniref:Uncharacterized protein n=1 Tax=Datura stramonium TaxID=4076 RepID=A0ABS8UW18_DATST|nr:hypothetical protein [Datura stramonium]
MGVEDVLTKESARLGEARPHGPARRDAVTYSLRGVADGSSLRWQGTRHGRLRCREAHVRLPCGARSSIKQKVKRYHSMVHERPIASANQRVHVGMLIPLPNQVCQGANNILLSVDRGYRVYQGPELSIQNICNRGQDIDHSSTTAVAKAQQSYDGGNFVNI